MATTQMPEDAAVAGATAKTEAMGRAYEMLAAALSEAATNLSQAAESFRRRGQHDKASIYDSDAETARAALQQARNLAE